MSIYQFCFILPLYLRNVYELNGPIRGQIPESTQYFRPFCLEKTPTTLTPLSGFLYKYISMKLIVKRPT
jgi:hypothetical protein